MRFDDLPFAPIWLSRRGGLDVNYQNIHRWTCNETNSFVGKMHGDTDDCPDFFVPERLSFVWNDYCVADNECAFPHSCVVRPKDAQGKGFTVLDKNG